jgi:hypothetical protein
VRVETSSAESSSTFLRDWIAVYEAGGHRYVVRVAFSNQAGIDGGSTVVVAAVLLNMDQQWNSVSSDLRKAWEHLGNVELRGQALLDQLRENPEAPAGKMLEVVARSLLRNFVSVFYEAVDRTEFEQGVARDSAVLEVFRDLPRDPYTQAMATCVDRVLNFMWPLNTQENVLWVADQGAQFEDELRASVRWKKVEHALAAGRGVKVPFVLTDTLYFADARESIPLQLADVCAAIIAGHLAGDLVAERFFQILKRTLKPEA